MKLYTKYYEDAFEQFRLRCPMWVDKAVKYVPRHETIIRVYLENGDYVDYDTRNETYRYISKDRLKERSTITDENCRSAFAKNLHELMRARLISQQVLTERSGISQAMLSKYLREKSTPTLTNIKKIAQALDCGIEELTEW